MSQPHFKGTPIEILRRSGGRADMVEYAVEQHMNCSACGGGGGNCYYPEDPCSECGFNYADSFGVEAIMDIIEERRKSHALD